MNTAPIPDKIIEAGKSEPMAIINFLKANCTVAAAARPDEKVLCPVSSPYGPKMTLQMRGYGTDCLCWGTGWKNGQVLCGRHIPVEPLQYYVEAHP